MKVVIFLLLTVAAFSIDTGIDNEICSVAPDLVLDYESNYAGYWNLDNECRALIRFDIAPTEEGAELVLILYRKTYLAKYSVYEIVNKWGSQVTWNTQPAVGEKVAEFTVTAANIYVVEVPRVPELGWMVKDDLGQMPPSEIWSFESEYPPRLEFPNPEINIGPVSLGRIKAVYR